MEQTRSPHIYTNNPTYLTSTHRVSFSFVISVMHMCTHVRKGTKRITSKLQPHHAQAMAAANGRHRLLHLHSAPQGPAPTQHKECRLPGSQLPGNHCRARSPAAIPHPTAAQCSQPGGITSRHGEGWRGRSSTNLGPLEAG